MKCLPMKSIALLGAPTMTWPRLPMFLRPVRATFAGVIIGTGSLLNSSNGVARIKHRLGQLIPAPVREIPIRIGGAGERKTVPLVGRYADIWHSFLDIETFRRKNDLVSQH